MQASLEMEEVPSPRGGMGTWHSQGPDRDEWLTPPHVLKALGPFDLDPCAPVRRPWDTAATHYTVHDNGLTKPWHGRVWLNPPYGNNTTRWIQRLAEHGNGVALIFARTETGTFFPWVWEHATSLLFLKGRLAFHFSDGSPSKTSAGAPSVLIAYGQANAEALANSGLAGKLLHNGPVEPDPTARKDHE
jgi:hypothetical protein